MNITPEVAQGSETLIVKPIEMVKPDPININPNLPQHPALLYITSPPGSGKSCLLQWLLAEPYNQFFNKIYIFSSTINKDVTWQKFVFDEDRKFESYSNEKFKKVIDEISNLEDEKCLIIVDDMTGQNIFTRGNELCKFISVHRHSPPRFEKNICGTSLWIISHQYKSIPKQIRGLMSDLVVFKLHSSDEMETISDDCRGVRISKEEFKKMYLLCTDEQYGFLYIKKKEKDNKRFRMNFDVILNLDFDETVKNKI
jgi:hypothetical protein